MSAVTIIDHADVPRARAAAFGLLAALLGPDPDAWRPGELAALRAALERLGVTEAIAKLDELERLEASDVQRRAAMLFSQARVSPYESGYVPTGVAGHTGRLADVAGFYRAFGFNVHGERPDHCSVELEFAAVVALAEMSATDRRDRDGAEVCQAAWRTFLRDHLGGWLDALADRVADLDPDGPHTLAARMAALVVDAELARLGVELAPITGGLPILDDDFEPRCGDCRYSAR